MGWQGCFRQHPLPPPAPTMKKPTAQEVKRKICSKIFELQSSLLAEDVGEIDEALLRECAAWFCPQHLQDIVIERSEVEGRCGWPGCGNKLPSWRLAAPLMFDLPEGEQLGRFCERSCMAKTKVFMSAIPPTPPYTRENLVRLACPPPAPSSAEGSTGVNGDGHGAEGAGAKKVYKRARRRDLPPRKERLPVGAVAAAAAGSVVADNAGEGVGVDRQEGGSEKSAGEEAPALAVPEKQAADEEAAASSPAAVSDEEGNEERVGTPAEASDIASGSSVRGEGVATVTAVLGEGVGADASGEDATASVRAALESVSISTEEEKDACSAVASSAPVVAAAAAAAAAAASPAPPASDVADVREATSTTAVKATAPVPTPPSTAWESVRFSRPSGSSSSSSGGCCSASVVSRHASLAAAAAETATMDTHKPSPSGGTISEARSREVKPSSPSSSSSSATNTPDKSGQRPAADSSRSSSPTRRRRVSFAEGTKESPQPNASSPQVASARGRAAAAKQARAAAVAADTGPGRRGGRGRGSGKASSGIARGGKPAAAPARKSVLGGIVERAPSVPAPMEVRVGGRVQGGAGAVEGHLPKIEADLSFRVMPRGGYPGDGGGDGPGFTGGGGRGVEEAKDAREFRLGLDGGPLTADEVEDEKETDEEDGAEGEEHSEDDADENDRAIWRETFGEEMPAEVSSGSWIDMDAVRDKEMREEFASSIAPFALLWSALSEWVSPETRAVCRAGRAAAAAAAALAVASPLPSAGKAKTSGLNGRSLSEIGDVAAEPTGSPAITAASCCDVSEQSPRIDSSHSSSASPGHLGSVPADFQARKAGAVAEAIEVEMSRHAKRNRDRRKANPNDSPIKGTGDSSARGGGATVSEGPTLTGALRHTGVSTMVNMHLAPAERALIAATTTLHVRGGGGGGGDGDGRSGILQTSGQHNIVGSRKKWVWSDTATGARQGARMPGGWVEEEGATTAAAAVAAEAVPLKAPSAGGGGKAKEETTGDDVPAVATASGTGTTARGKHADAETNQRESPAITVAGRQTRKAQAAEPAAAAAAAAAAGEHVAGGGAECRRAVSAVIDTLNVAAGSASSATAADLSIAQWKVVSVVLLTAVGLGAGAIGGGGGGDGEGGAAAHPVTGEEAEVAAEACARLCGAEMGVSAREFRILVDVMLEE